MQPETQTTLDVLLGVRELLSDAQRLERNCYATNAVGDPCNPESPAAVRWCLIGAIMKCGAFRDANAAHRRLADLAAKEGDYLVGVNLKGHAAVLELLDQGIAEERRHAA